MREYPIISGKDAERFIKRAEWLEKRLKAIENTETVKWKKGAPKGKRGTGIIQTVAQATK
jgi:hypothetical protein